MIERIWRIGIQSRGVVAAMLLVSIVMLLGPVPTAHGATLTVNVTNDEFNTDSDCSLREAIYAANYNVEVSGCPAGSATRTDAIILANGPTYILTLAGSDDTGLLGDLDIINNNVSLDLMIYVDGLGSAYIHQNAIPDDRIFDILGTQTTAVIMGVTMRYGSTPNAGGAVRNEGKLTLSHVNIYANIAGSGGGIYNNGRLSILNASVIDLNVAENWGGGIVSSDYLFISEDSTVSRGSAELGGGIFNVGDAIIEYSNIITNTAERGGGIFHTTPYGSLTISNSDINDNFASLDGGGIEVAQGTVNITNSTLIFNAAPNGSAIYNQLNGGPITVSGSCFRHNENVAVVNDAIYRPPMNAVGNSWGSGTGPGPVGPGSGDRISTAVLYDPWLQTAPSYCY